MFNAYFSLFQSLFQKVLRKQKKTMKPARSLSLFYYIMLNFLRISSQFAIKIHVVIYREREKLLNEWIENSLAQNVVRFEKKKRIYIIRAHIKERPPTCFSDKIKFLKYKIKLRFFFLFSSLKGKTPIFTSTSPSL